MMNKEEERPTSHHHVALPLSKNFASTKKTSRFAILWVSDIIRATLLPPKHSTKIVIVKSTIDYFLLLSPEKFGNTLLACHTGTLVLMVSERAVLAGTENTCLLVGGSRRRARTRRVSFSSGTRKEACPSRCLPFSSRARRRDPPSRSASIFSTREYCPF
jgi:hypothetical protein